jgi:hypothetical protein
LSINLYFLLYFGQIYTCLLQFGYWI